MSSEEHKQHKNEKTFDCQSSLPALPLPSLQQTCTKYLESVQPFVCGKDYYETEFQVNLFKNGIGKHLHQILQHRANKSRNWVQDDWYDSYLSYRGPLPVLSNISGGCEISEYHKAEIGIQYQRSALWIYHIIKKFLSIIRQEIPIQKFGKKHNADMTQLSNIFCCGRMPGEKKDTIVNSMHLLPKKDGLTEVVAEVKHIVVLLKGKIFRLKVLNETGDVLTPPMIKSQLLKIAQACSNDDGISIGSLTAADRSTWYKAYRHLCKLDKQNQININVINEAIIAFAFDDVKTYTCGDVAKHGILGDCVNRWYDKGCCGIVSSTGLVTFTGDHVHADANTTTRILQDVFDACTESEFKWKGDPTTTTHEDPIELQFTVDEYITDIIKETQVKHRHLVTLIDFVDKPIVGFGKTYTKAHKINPDTLVQLAIQLGYYSLHNRVMSTYESATTRKFYHGRTETVRSCTNQSKCWVESMCDKTSTNIDRKKLFMVAVEQHDQLMADACNGQGIDRHLFVLQKLAKEEGIDTPGIFKDKAWKISGGDASFVISSSLSGFFALHGGLAPMSHDGYGTFYTIEKHSVNMHVSEWKASKETDCAKLHQSISQAFYSIQELLMDNSKL